MNDFSLPLVVPTLSLAVFGLFTLVISPALRGMNRVLGTISLIGVVVSAFTCWSTWKSIALYGPQTTANGMVRVDSFGLFFSFILLLIGGLSILYSITFLEREDADEPEFYPLMLLCLAGMFIMVHTTHLMMVLIGLEVFSLALYVLTGLTRSRARSVEGALKYFLLGAFSSGFIVFGMALLYGSAQSLELAAIGRAASSAPSPLLWLGMGLVLIGLAFKIAIVPFHQWVPDVYQGAPTNVTGFMAAATKTAAIAVLLRFLVGAFGLHNGVWIPLITVLAILTMTVANLIALAQTNVKRLLAYSSIAHAGYLLIAVVCRPSSGVAAIVFYLTSYALMTVGVFAVVAAVGRGNSEREAGYELYDLAGLGWRRPMLGAAMAFFLFSLAGMPPTAGFLGKYVIFRAAIESDAWLLAIVGVLNATIAAYYYLRVIVSLYMREPETDELPAAITPSSAAVMAVSMIGVMYLGLAPGRLLELVKNLASSIL